jgi:protein O-GlcNAc transferase
MASARELGALMGRAMNALQAGRIAEAQKCYKAVLKEVPNHVPTLHFLGLTYFQEGKPSKGIEFVQKALALKPDYIEAHYNLANALQDLGRLDDAVKHYRQALAINSINTDAHNNLGAALHKLGRYEEAIGHFKQALAIRPGWAHSHNNIGNAFKELRRYDEAISHFKASLAVDPHNVETRCNLGAALQEGGWAEESLAVYEGIIALDPNFADAELGRGNALSKLGRLDDALAAFGQALAVKSDLAEAWLGRGNLYGDLKRYDEAFAAYDQALTLKSDLAEAWLGLGRIFYELKRQDEAFAAYDRAFFLKPDLPEAEGYRLHSKMQLCDWNNIDSEAAHLISSIRSGMANSGPFPLLAINSSAADQLQCARLWMSHRHPVAKKAIWQDGQYDHNRIRLGYLSADFRDHPVSYLVAGMLEQHDRARFELTGLSIAAGDNSDIGERVKNAFDRFLDVHAQSDAEIAELVRKMEIDIAIDLTCFTQGGRMGIFAKGSAPIQVNYLGSAGTTGANFMDYIIADCVVIPTTEREFYSEKVVHLPNMFMASDFNRKISERVPQRTEYGLPDSGFVFCSFNNSYKITPRIFEIWMHLLRQVDDSVLWLSHANDSASRQLRSEAVKRGVDPYRLVFAQRVALNEEHIARYRLADLFLDTLPYNAHATTSDALWAGLPVLTCAGETLASRVAASLLNAIDLPELITITLDDYEKAALDLAQNREKHAMIRRKLAHHRATKPLFNTKLFTKHIEAAYTAMYERHKCGLAPDHLIIAG